METEDEDIWSLIARWGSVLRGPRDEFFSEGDSLCQMRSVQYLVQEDEEEFLHRDFPSFPCPNCSAVFSQLIDYEAHYESRHRYSCSQCSSNSKSKSFPSAHLLELHVTETHDSYFQCLSLKKPSYECFLEKCSEKFWTPSERKDHSIKLHQFNSNFESGFDLSLKRNKKNKKIRKKRPVSIATMGTNPDVPTDENGSSSSPNSKTSRIPCLPDSNVRRNSLAESPKTSPSPKQRQRIGSLSLAKMGQRLMESSPPIDEEDKNSNSSSSASGPNSLTAPSNPAKVVVKASKIPVRSFSYKGITFGRGVSKTFDLKKHWHSKNNTRRLQAEKQKNFEDMEELKMALPGIK